MSEQTCSNCAFFVQDDRGSACNAFHPPDDRPIDCVDWELREGVSQISDPPNVRTWADFIPEAHQETIGAAVQRQLSNLPRILQREWQQGAYNLAPRFFREASRFISIPHPEYWRDDRLLDRLQYVRWDQLTQTWVGETEIEGQPIRITAHEIEIRRQPTRSRETPRLPTISLSEFRRLTAGIPAPRNLNDRWTIPWGCPASYVVFSLDDSFERVTLTPIETSDGLKWQFQGTVIID